MVHLVFLLHFLINSCGAIQPTTTDKSETSSVLGVIPSVDVLFQVYIGSQRSTLDILWSCLATTFAVTWLSVHPNIPTPGEKIWWITWRRFKLMVWAFVAPEFIVLWAWRQRRAACRLAEEVRILAKARNQKYGHDWTTTHGHFLQMGGFCIQSDKRSPRVLYFKQFQSMVGKTFDIPSISADEIDDKGKSDPLGKMVAALQILWFIVQVIARHMNHLVITQLEFTTAALACLNATMYILWWSKPLDVRCPVVIHPYPSPSRHVDEVIRTQDPVICRDPPSSSLNNTSVTASMTENEEKSVAVPHLAQIKNDICNPAEHNVSCDKRVVSLTPRSFLDTIRAVLVSLVAFLNRIIAKLLFQVGHLISPFIHLVVGIVMEQQMALEYRTPTFYVWPGNNSVGYNTETTSAVKSKIFGTQSAIPSSNGSIVLLISYCVLIARILLFLDSLLAFRALPSPAFATLNWLSIIPHI
ncbi:hypothetical protein Clacol_003411 [Clathrus columnatus]|uniref:Uncharacterized protein n=1 Tax=Clathrus columnatus TaxID=1419009 RepID=A0AAV5A8X3_9AGAM|nr:hypothetical protein Clacol_003411 [Clathrus columnatus]